MSVDEKSQKPATAEEKTVSKSFLSTVEGLSDATSFLSAALDGSACADPAKTQLMIALDEIGSNIVRYSGAPEFTVRVESSESSPVVRLVFMDAGRPYNPLEHADPDITLKASERAIGGLGLMMVKKMMDEIQYEHLDGCNVLTIGKRR